MVQDTGLHSPRPTSLASLPQTLARWCLHLQPQRDHPGVLVVMKLRGEDAFYLHTTGTFVFSDDGIKEEANDNKFMFVHRSYNNFLSICLIFHKVENEI